MNSDAPSPTSQPPMKKHIDGKSESSARTFSQSVGTNFVAKHGKPPRHKKHGSRRSSRRIDGENIDGLGKPDSSISGLAKQSTEDSVDSKGPITIPAAKNDISPLETVQERPESPVNPYNKIEYPKSVAQWPEENTRVSSVLNIVESLECEASTNSDAKSCSCCSTSKHDNDCCKEDLARKTLYNEIKARVTRAVKRHKIFLIRGDLPKLAKALEERGWIQKYESTKTRMIPYGSVASLDSKSLGNIRQPDGTINERAVVFALLRHKPADLIWDCRNDFIDWDSSLRNHVILNRLQRAYVYTSKLGMAHILQDSHWLYESDVANVQYPRSYNASREPHAFSADYRITAVTGLLKWFVSRVEKGEGFVDLGIEPIPISQLEFAIERCEEFLAETTDRNIDSATDSTQRTNDDLWSLFLDDYSRVLHKGNGIASPRNEAQSRFEKCYLSASSTLKKLKDLDPQYELNGMRNIWILKPSDLCCGTGISISHNFKDILRRVNGKPKDYFIVQKYIEKPLLIKETKFDIRLWYLVTNTFPLTIWIYEEALLRFSSKPYTFATYHEAIHICNTAIQQKYSDENRRRRRRIMMGNTDERAQATAFESIRDQGWDCAKLNEYLKSVGYKGEPYYDEIHRKMSQAIVLTMLASQDYMDKRRCSFELYGADFMVMDDLSVWLIEINTNPRMHPPSSRITQRLYDGVLESLVKVVMDLPLNSSAETGGFRLTYKQKTPTDFQPYLGPCLFVFGKQMTLHEPHQRASKKDKDQRENIFSPWGKHQNRAWTAPPMIPRRRDPKVVDLIDYLNSSRCTAAR